MLVRSGLARIYGTPTPLPDGRDSREYLAHLHAPENEAKAAKRSEWVWCSHKVLRQSLSDVCSESSVALLRSVILRTLSYVFLDM